MAPPRLDPRTADQLLEQLWQRAGVVAPEWVWPASWRSEPSDDVGLTLARVYVHFLEILLDRLNRVPEKNLLAFLDLLGIGLLPPGVARAPVVFGLASTANASGLVPAGTQVATVQTEHQSAVIYETTQDLTVVAARLVAAYGVEPSRDRYGDFTPTVIGQEPVNFFPFAGDRPIDHLLFVGSDPLFHLPRHGRLELAITPGQGAKADDVIPILRSIIWEASISGRWQMMPNPYILATSSGAAGEPVPHAIVSFDAFPGADVLPVVGPGLAGSIESRWIRGRPQLSSSGSNTANTTMLLLNVTPQIRVQGGSLELAQITKIDSENNVVTIKPTAVQAHLAGSLIRKMGHLPASGPTEHLVRSSPRGSTEIELGTATPLMKDVLVVINEQTDSEEYVSIEGIMSKIITNEGNVTSITYRTSTGLRFSHDKTATVRKIEIENSSPSTVSVSNILPPASTLSLASVSGLAEGDILQIEDQSGFLPDRIHVNGSAIDVTRSFLPFGQTPKAGDVCFFASANAFPNLFSNSNLLPNTTFSSNEQSEISLQFTLNASIDRAITQWNYLQRVDNNVIWISAGTSQINDQTNGLSKNGTIEVNSTLMTSPATFLGNSDNSYILAMISVTNGMYQIPPAVMLSVQNQAPATAFMTDGRLANSAIESTKPTITDILRIPGVVPVDLARLFYPFGLFPISGSTFYIFLPVAPSSFSIAVSVQVPQPSVQLLWEYTGENGWQRLGESSSTLNSLSPSAWQFSDNTLALTRSGDVSFLRPADFAPAPVDGQTNYWVRAGIMAGDYGRPAEYVPIDPADVSKGSKLRPGTGWSGIPVVSTVRLAFTTIDQEPTVLTQSQFVVQNQTVENAASRTYKAFEPIEDEGATFYLGFDRVLPNDPVNLFFASVPKTFVEWFAGVDSSVSGSSPALKWEYWNGRDWPELLGTFDHTNGLTESGIVQFIGPVDLAPLAKFEPTPHFWIRARRANGDRTLGSILQGIYLNAVEVDQAATTRDEVLGSSSGRGRQSFRFAKSPVLPGQQIVIREPERPPAAEEAAIVQEEGDNAIEIKTGSEGSAEIWIRWHNVANVGTSDRTDRHYSIDHVRGEVMFGDGVHGMIPPAGRDNVVARLYRSGGGESGNQPTGAIRQLKTSIPYISGVANPIAADGGSAAETAPEVQQRGPQALKNRGRAVTNEDFEWLARQAAGTRVARAKALSDRELGVGKAGITLVIVPSGNDLKPTPSSSLTREVEDYIAVRSFVGPLDVATALVNVVGPGFLPVELAVEIVPIALPEANRVRLAVLEALQGFFHPLTGGLKKRGWELGQDAFLSEVYALLEDLPGVEHVRNLRYKPNVAALTLALSVSKPSDPIQIGEGMGAMKDLTVKWLSTTVIGFTEKQTPSQDYGEGTVVVAGGRRIATLARALSKNRPFSEIVIEHPLFPVAGSALSAGTRVSLTNGNGDLIATLSEPIQRGQQVSTLALVIFQEGERVRVGDEANGVNVTIKAISGSTLAVDAFRAPVKYPAGTTVASTAGPTSSVLASDIAEGALITQLEVKGFDTSGGENTLVRLGGDADQEDLTFSVAVRSDDPGEIALGERLRVPDSSLVYSGDHTITIVPNGPQDVVEP